jgi:hypothetical protein
MGKLALTHSHALFFNNLQRQGHTMRHVKEVTTTSKVSSKIPPSVQGTYADASREHLRRKHVLEKLQCERCWREFTLKQEFEEHDGAINSHNECQLLDKPRGYTNVMSQRQRSRIYDRRKSREVGTDDEKWRVIYHILFPLEAIPSPC